MGYGSLSLSLSLSLCLSVSLSLCLSVSLSLCLSVSLSLCLSLSLSVSLSLSLCLSLSVSLSDLWGMKFYGPFCKSIVCLKQVNADLCDDDRQRQVYHMDYGLVWKPWCAGSRKQEMLLVSCHMVKGRMLKHPPSHSSNQNSSLAQFAWTNPGLAILGTSQNLLNPKNPKQFRSDWKVTFGSPPMGQSDSKVNSKKAKWFKSDLKSNFLTRKVTQSVFFSGSKSHFWVTLGRPRKSFSSHSWSTIVDKIINYKIFIPDELFG